MVLIYREVLLSLKESVFIFHRHDAPEELAGTMGCYPTREFLIPDIGKTVMGLHWRLLSNLGL
jgi:hypothetical protein